MSWKALLSVVISCLLSLQLKRTMAMYVVRIILCIFLNVALIRLVRTRQMNYHNFICTY